MYQQTLMKGKLRAVGLNELLDGGLHHLRLLKIAARRTAARAEPRGDYALFVFGEREKTYGREKS